MKNIKTYESFEPEEEWDESYLDNIYVKINGNEKNRVTIGTRVRISDNSRFYNQGIWYGKKMVGKIKNDDLPTWDFDVSWENGTNYYYDYHDLEYLEEDLKS